MVYYVTNTAIYDSTTQRYTFPGALYNKVERYKYFPMVHEMAFHLVEVKRGGTQRIGENRFPKPGAFVKIVNR
ncbi:MAG: hypothetical protein J6P99_03705 [Paludibacteraceae bacterium]|nr:hypothetical protein [Paludibacteraceae bacterium]